MSRSAIRGNRLAGAQSVEVDRGAELSPRQQATYWCATDHKTVAVFAADIEAPSTWTCSECGGPATALRGTAPPATVPPAFHRTSYEFLLMRRTPAEGAQLLDEALERLHRNRRAAGRG
jgi:RNA polymerase binding protein RbpA